VDRKALPDPDMDGLLEGQYQAPSNTAERQLAEIFRELLGVKRIGIHDNFFELGGDSIISIQVVSRAQRAGYVLRPRDLFTYQTIAGLSEVLAERSGEEMARGVEQGILTGTSGLLPIQEWFFSQEQASVSHFNQSILLGIDKSIALSTLEKALRELVLTHDALRFRYRRDASGWHQEYGDATVVLDVEDMSTIPAGELAEGIKERSEFYQAGLDIFKGILVRAVLFQTPEPVPQDRLLIIVHHLAVDGVSWRILIDDLSTLLHGPRSQAKDNASAELSLRRKTSSYRQWYEELAVYA
jgi:aryl carrier-like protein